jgi:hypothetical protein
MTPGIVTVVKFCESGGTAFSSYLNYMDREEATWRKDNDQAMSFGGYMDYMDDDAKVAEGDQPQLELGSALFTHRKDNLTKDEKKEIKNAFRSAQEAGSNMWQVVISFNNVYLKKCGLYDYDIDLLNEPMLKQAGRKAIDTMLRNEKLENALWTASIHRNTDNIHIHVAIVEPTPMREEKEYILYRRNPDGTFARDDDHRKIPELDDYGEPVRYTARKGKFKPKSIEVLKSTLRAELENNRQIYASITTILRDTILLDKKSRSLLDTPEFTRSMMTLYDDLKESGIERQYWNYNRNIMMNFRPQIDALSDLFVQTYHRDDFAHFLDKVEREQARQSRAYGGFSPYKENMLHGKEGIYARLGNAILRELQQYDRAVTVRDVSKIAKTQRAPGSTVQHSVSPLHNMRQLRRGLHSLEHLLLVNYEKAINQREAERLQEEIAHRGYRGFEI